MGKKKRKKNKLLQVEKFVVCPSCRRPFFRKSTLKIEGAGRGYGFCRNCGFELRRVFSGTPAGKGIDVPEWVKPTTKPTIDSI